MMKTCLDWIFAAYMVGFTVWSLRRTKQTVAETRRIHLESESIERDNCLKMALLPAIKRELAVHAFLIEHGSHGDMLSVLERLERLGHLWPGVESSEEVGEPPPA